VGRIVSIKTLTLRRIGSYPDAMLGNLYDHTNGLFLCTMERPWKDNTPQISCIPDGLYLCKHFNGKRFKDVWEVTKVKGRTAILIHQANYAAELEGCIAVGLYHDNSVKDRMVCKSRDAMADLKSYIGRSPDGKLKDFFLNVVTIT
jgi:hypothetical protein